MYNELVLILMLALFKNKDENKLNLLNNKSITIGLDIPYAMEKIHIVKKIGPYFPEEFIPSINKALMVTEKFIKVYQAIEFIQNTEADYIQNIVPVENNQQRLSYIAETIKKEFSKEEIDQMGSAVGVVLTIDRFNKLFQILNTFVANPDSINDPTNIINLMKPLIEGKGEKEKKQLEDMTKMLEIMKTLDSPKKTSENKEQN